MKMISFRLTDEQVEHLEALTKAHNTNRTKLLASMIEAEYDALNDNPKVKKALELMQQMNELLKGAGQANGEKH